MENHLQSFDVCIICALPEEVRAFLTVVKPHCEDGLEEHTSPRYRYSYRSAALRNDKNELLTLHISWLPRYGPQEMTLHLLRVLEECQPRIAIMTGICAGDAQQVCLGDLVVAERTFTYDNGKFVLDEQGRSVHLHDTLTYQLDANILQFLGMFDDWEPLVARLEGPPSMLNQQKTACHIKAIASGSAVRADKPFQDVQAPVRGTVAIDMEGAAFGLVMSRHPLTHWLIVKGICDYADRTKNDAYHDYAACASASYALRFIQAYVTTERLPRPYGSSPSSRVGLSLVWNVPYLRNPHFTGREELLDQLEQQLSPVDHGDSGITHRAVLTQTQAIKGLGGIGKTQIAVEYAYRSRDLSRYAHTLWVNAASEGALITSFATLAELLPEFPAKDETDLRKLVKEIKRWLEQCEQRWLLIFDNADDVSLLHDFFPQGKKGSILLTTRANAVGSLGASSIEVENMGLTEGTEFLLHRSQRQKISDEERDEATNVVIALDCFPLALDQAGAYIEETQCSFSNYLQVYQTRRKELLARRGLQITNYPEAVATTWSLSFQQVEQANPAATELLRLCAFLAPDAIPEELIRDGVAQWSLSLQQAAIDPFAFDQAITELLRFSLVKRSVEAKTLSIHRLVQAVQIDAIEQEIQIHWAERVIRAINDAFPLSPKDMTMWSQCRRYLDQVQACSVLIDHYKLMSKEAANLLNRVGDYLQVSGLWTVAESPLQHALMIREEVLGTSHPDTATTLNNLGLLYWTQGRYSEAERLLQRVLMIREKILETNHPDTAATLHYLGLLYWRQGHYMEAEKRFQHALVIKNQSLGASHPDTASTMDELGLLYSSQGRYAEAKEMLQRALAVREQTRGITHHEVAATLHNLGRLYWKQDQYMEAEELLQRARTIREQRLGATHPETMNTLFNLGLCYSCQGRYAEAEQLYRQALLVFQQVFVPNHPDIGYVLEAHALLLLKRGRIFQAARTYSRALKAVGIKKVISHTWKSIRFAQH